MKKPVIIVIILVVLGILGFFGYSLLTASKVPQAFIDTHNEKVALDEEAAQVSDLTILPGWNEFEQQVNEKNYTEALVILESALARKAEAAAKLDAAEAKIAELKTAAEGIKDAEIKTSADNFIEMAGKENTAKITYNDLQTQMLEKLKSMISIMEKSSTISAADQKTIDDLGLEIDGLTSQIDTAKSDLDAIQIQYQAAESDFFELAGLEAKG
ncbi:MAG: hypothetical protein ABIH38_03325 [Patescibacteria group bacterium]